MVTSPASTSPSPERIFNALTDPVCTRHGALDGAGPPS